MHVFIRSNVQNDCRSVLLLLIDYCTVDKRVDADLDKIYWRAKRSVV